MPCGETLGLWVEEARLPLVLPGVLSLQGSLPLTALGQIQQVKAATSATLPPANHILAAAAPQPTFPGSESYRRGLM